MRSFDPASVLRMVIRPCSWTTGASFFSQRMVGRGFPATLQCSVAVWPWKWVMLLTGSWNSRKYPGGDEMKCVNGWRKEYNGETVIVSYTQINSSCFSHSSVWPINVMVVVQRSGCTSSLVWLRKEFQINNVCSFDPSMEPSFKTSDGKQETWQNHTKLRSR